MALITSTADPQSSGNSIESLEVLDITVTELVFPVIVYDVHRL